MYGLREGPEPPPPQTIYIEMCMDAHTSGRKGALLLASQWGPRLTKVEESLSRMIFTLCPKSDVFRGLRFEESVILLSNSAILHVRSQDQQQYHQELVGNASSQALPQTS